MNGICARTSSTSKASRIFFKTFFIGSRTDSYERQYRLRERVVRRRIRNQCLSNLTFHHPLTRAVLTCWTMNQAKQENLPTRLSPRSLFRAPRLSDARDDRYRSPAPRDPDILR